MSYKRYKGKEDDFQKSVASYLDSLSVLWFHPPNEIKAKPQYLKKRKLLGVKAGVPDIIILEPNKEYNGLLIELKANYNKPTDEQGLFLDKAGFRGYKAVWTNSLDECIDIIDEYLSKK